MNKVKAICIVKQAITKRTDFYNYNYKKNNPGDIGCCNSRFSKQAHVQ